MKRLMTFMTWAFFAAFFMGVLIILCGIGEFCAPLLLIGGITAIGGFVLSVVCFTIGERIGNKNR